jgi:hypothetical protein
VEKTNHLMTAADVICDCDIKPAWQIIDFPAMAIATDWHTARRICDQFICTYQDISYLSLMVRICQQPYD